MKITYGPIDAARALAHQFKQNNPNARIIDIGGTTSGWSQSIVDLTVDIIAPFDDKNVPLDICVESQWKFLLNRVATEGLFDYCICTHTLEDLYNPFSALTFMPKVAKAGIISMPSLKQELSHKESPFYYGYFHHRWLFTAVNDRMLVIPKVESIREFISQQTCSHDEEEIIFQWENEIPYDIFMNNYLGPDKNAVQNEYRKLV